MLKRFLDAGGTMEQLTEARDRLGDALTFQEMTDAQRLRVHVTEGMTPAAAAVFIAWVTQVVSPGQEQADTGNGDA